MCVLMSELVIDKRHRDGVDSANTCVFRLLGGPITSRAAVDAQEKPATSHARGKY